MPPAPLLRPSWPTVDPDTPVDRAGAWREELPTGPIPAVVLPVPEKLRVPPYVRHLGQRGTVPGR